MRPASLIVGMLLGSAAALAEGVSRSSFIGTWESEEHGELAGRLILEKDKGRLLTFRGLQHMSTIFFWWNLNQAKNGIHLGVNGEAIARADGGLTLSLRPANTNLVTIRETILRRVKE